MAYEYPKVYEQYLPFIRFLASSYPQRHRDDLIQEGLWGLYLGCGAFDPSRGVPFDAFIKVCIRNRLVSAARRYSSEEAFLPLEDLGGVLPSQETTIEEKFAEQDALRGALMDLRPRLSSLECKVLDLYLAGNSLSAVASALEISSKSADNAMTRIKKKIREFLPYL